MRQIHKFTVVCFAALLIGIGIGYVIGTITILNWGVNKAVYFLDLKGIELDIDDEQLAYNIYNFKNRINQCYPTIEQNAFIYNDTGAETGR